MDAMGCGALQSTTQAPTEPKGAAPSAAPEAAEQQGEDYILALAPTEPEGAAPSAAPEAAEQQEEDWSWTRVILERYQVRGVDILGIGNFSIVRRGKELEGGCEVAVKSLMGSSDAKFRREMFLFQELFDMDADAQDDASAPSRPRSCKRSATLQAIQASDLPRPAEVLVRLLDHSPLDAFARGLQSVCVLELGNFNLSDLIIHCTEMAKKGKAHSLSTPDELLRVALHVLRGLSFLHWKMFIHGDLKPANVMWFGGKQQGAWKLIDLDGLLTSTQLVDARDADFFTPVYAAPELAAAVSSAGFLRVSRRLDVWSAGVVFMEMELLMSPLWSKYEELCAGSDDGFSRFMRWLAETPTPITVPSAGRAASVELLGIIRESMLVDSPTARGTPQDLLAHSSYLSGGFAVVAGLPPPTLEEPQPPPKQKPKTAFQLFQEAHKAEVAEETGLKGSKLVLELQKRWKQLLAEGGEELARLKQQEADEAAAFQN